MTAQIPNEANNQAIDLKDPEPVSNILEKFEAAQQAIHAENFDYAATLYTDVLTKSKDLSQLACAFYNQALIADKRSRIRYQGGDLVGALELMQTAEDYASVSLEIYPQDTEYQGTFDQIVLAKKAIEALIKSQEQASNQQKPSEEDTPPSEDQSADSNEYADKESVPSNNQTSDDESQAKDSRQSESTKQQSPSQKTDKQMSQSNGGKAQANIEKNASNSSKDSSGKNSVDEPGKGVANSNVDEASQNGESNQQSMSLENVEGGDNSEVLSKGSQLE